MNRGRWGANAVGVVLLTALLSACGVFGGGESRLQSLDGMPAEQILSQGESALEVDRDYERAVHYFSELERLYPYSAWAQRGLVMQAYAYHRMRDYEDSRAAAQRYLDLFPAADDAAYAQYLLALSYYDQIEEVGRDQGLTFDALEALQVVFEQYPDSEFARTAEMQFDLAFDHLAAKEMEVGRFYLKRGHYAAASNRFRNVVESFETSTHTPEALHRLAEAYMALGLTDEAQTAGAILGHNFRGNEFYGDSYRLLTGAGLAPEAAGEGWLRDVYRRTVRGEWL